VKLTGDPPRRTLAVGVVLPVHNEEELVQQALSSLNDAFAELKERELDLRIVVVLDNCCDNSLTIVEEWVRMQSRTTNSVPTTLVACEANNVGIARGLGCTTLLEQFEHLDPGNIWIATTDADSRVPDDWLRMQVLQHESGVDLWCGRVAVGDWSSRGDGTAARWQHEYEVESHPIHGTNLGFNAQTYLAAGGFNPSQVSEDRELCAAIEARGAVIHFDSSVRVVTSARRDARSPLGFAHALNLIEMSVGLSTGD
jgi:cellulose synthase/poly-beta-1,6-N-acetylglucosamine synthase-like glycosyltransferase